MDVRQIPRYNVTCKQRWPGGNLEIYAEVAQGLTQEITIYGDFMATRSMQEITDALTGSSSGRRPLPNA